MLRYSKLQKSQKLSKIVERLEIAQRRSLMKCVRTVFYLNIDTCGHRCVVCSMCVYVLLYKCVRTCVYIQAGCGLIFSSMHIRLTLKQVMNACNPINQTSYERCNPINQTSYERCNPINQTSYERMQSNKSNKLWTHAIQ